MGEAGGDPVPVVDGDLIAVAGFPARADDHARGGCLVRGAHWGHDVNALVGPGDVQHRMFPHRAEGAGEPALRRQDGRKCGQTVPMRLQAVGSLVEGERQEVGAADEAVQVHRDFTGLANQLTTGCARGRPGGCWSADAGLQHLWVGRVQIGEQADARVALGDLAEGIGEAGDPRVELAEGRRQLLVFPLEPGGPRQIHAATHGGIPQHEGKQHHQAERNRPDLQDRLRDLNGPGRARPFGDHHERPATICHATDLCAGWHHGRHASHGPS